MTASAGKRVAHDDGRLGVTIQGLTTPWHTWVLFDGEDKPEAVEDRLFRIQS